MELFNFKKRFVDLIYNAMSSIDHVTVRGIITSLEFSKFGLIKATIQFLSRGMYRQHMSPELMSALDAFRVNHDVHRISTVISYDELTEALQGYDRSGWPIANWKISIHRPEAGTMEVQVNLER